MNGNLGQDMRVEPEHMQMLISLFVLILIPLFDKVSLILNLINHACYLKCPVPKF